MYCCSICSWAATRSSYSLCATSSRISGSIVTMEVSRLLGNEMDCGTKTLFQSKFHTWLSLFSTAHS